MLMTRTFSTCQVAKFFTRDGWQICRVISRARNSPERRPDESWTSFNATRRLQQGDSASQTSAYPPRPRRLTSRYPEISPGVRRLGENGVSSGASRMAYLDRRGAPAAGFVRSIASRPETMYGDGFRRTKGRSPAVMAIFIEPCNNHDTLTIATFKLALQGIPAVENGRPATRRAPEADRLLPARS